MPLDAADAKKNAGRAHATAGQICEAFRSVFGSYTETSASVLSPVS
jgi:hypothetical protein